MKWGKGQISFHNPYVPIGEEGNVAIQHGVAKHLGFAVDLHTHVLVEVHEQEDAKDENREQAQDELR